ncbi:unnamed protein product [Echinostoma caproni]|uniref:Transcription initiation factor TFIID subunit 7 n=1 Tax=Echinostoma caproni TaxID=27848 RepID=A0A183A322_9TREM|nr:unnamed protein product [Echinostoma caproni]
MHVRKPMDRVDKDELTVEAIFTDDRLVEIILWLPFSEFFSIASNPVKPYEIAVCGRSEAIIRVYDRRKMDPHDPCSGYLHCYGAEHLRPKNRNQASPTRNGSASRRSASRAALNDEPDDNQQEFLITEDNPVDADEDSEDEGDDDDAEEQDGDDAFFSSLSSRIGRRVRAVLRRLRGRARIALRVQGNQSGRGNRSNLSYGLETSKFSCTAAVYSNQGDGEPPVLRVLCAGFL